ncbi:MAG: DUF5777 family beta-barrel protein [Bacteroidota bacterium]|nr:DUF5777 family beta-barrel protein [Bacteroidota bacterium]
MKRYTKLTAAACIIAFLSSGLLIAQDEPTPVMPAFETLTLVDGQTTANPYKGQMVLEIQHRFSQIEEIADLFGIYGSANTRIGLSYGITDKIMVGFGTTRKNMLQDLEWKYSILTQNSKLPISLTYHGNAVLDARDAKYYGPEEDYKFAYRMSYLNQLIVSSRIGDKISLQMAPTFVWFNAVPEGYSNTNASINFGGRFQVLGFHSIILEYEQPLIDAEEDVYPNLAFGVEIGTSTHSFRVFASTYDYIVRNQSIAYNSNNPWDGDFRFGFNITIRF